ncbi:mitochondrial DNA polymerase I protein B [Angomonas deanei]|nr:mitochondrial DNA polymerase I protein B [Angomonas deanei]|eukprot:EPY39975.1 mitochondrial DNA polymerase I protein B [Angomonas deanei]
MNLSVWHVQRQKRYHAKGMLSDIIGGLIQSHARRIIFLPTNRTDRRLLFSCRAALLKTGCLCTVVYASDLSEQFRGNYQSDPSRYWTSLKEDGRVLDADLLLHIYQAAGVTLRASHKTYLLESGKVKEEDTKPLQEEDALVCRTDVEEWLAPLRSPARVAAEEAQLQQYTKYLVIGYTTTEHTAHGQPNCATAAVNYVIATAMMDDEGHTLLPWVYHEARGELRLPSLDRYDVLVLHGAKRFLLFCWQDPELVRFLRRGGRVWCTQQAEYILEAQRVKSGGNQLENVALKYGFHTPPSSVIGQTKEELPFSFHRRFLVEAVTATRGVFQGQLTKAVRQSQLLCAAHRMDALLAMTAMEYSGIFIDIKEAERQSLVLQNSASVIDQALQAYVPTEVPQDMRLSFDWTSVTVMHAYLFGGKITIGLTTSARTKWSWLNNLVHLCFRFGHWDQLSSEVHLRRYVALSGLEATSNVTKRIGEHLVQQNSSKKKYRLVLFDIETTGLNPATDAVIEVALYDPVSNNSFTSLVNPQRPITPRTTEIHKITNAAVKGAPTIDVVGKSVAKFLKLDAKSYNENEVLVLVGHNVFSIDEPMLRRAVAPHVSQEAGDGVLYCDSLAMLRALKMQLQHSRMVGSRKKNKDVLEKLTSSLRLGDLIKNLNIVPEGSLHRADTDTRALWYVLVNAYGLGGKSPSEQVQHLLKEAANTLVTFPSTGCFVPTDRRQQALQVLLPGVASDTIKNQKLLHSLEKQPLSDTVLKTLKGHGLKVADLLLRRMQLDQYAFRFFHSDSKTLNVIHDDHTVHQLIDTTSSNTSRTVSAYPSCQNIPKDDKSSVRRLFASRFGAMGRCIEIDYSQLEIYVLAVLCNDENLTRDLKNGVDFHIKRAAFFSGLSYEEIEKGYKKGDPRFVKLRKTAKQFSFQRLYGAGVPLLHKTTGISVKDLTASIAAEDKEYPGIAAFHRMTRSVALRPNNPGPPHRLRGGDADRTAHAPQDPRRDPQPTAAEKLSHPRLRRGAGANDGRARLPPLVRK